MDGEYDQLPVEERYREVFQLLDENESGEITLDELGRFLRELFKEQTKELQELIEREKLRKVATGAGGSPLRSAI